MNNVASLTKAYSLAAQWHARQRRKGDAEGPYVNQLAEVAHFVAWATASERLSLELLIRGSRVRSPTGSPIYKSTT